VALKVAAKSTLAKEWRSQAGERLHRMRRPAVVVEGMGGPADDATVGGAFLAAASGSGSRLKAVLSELDAEAPFEAAFAKAFQGSPPAVFEAWLAREGKKRGGNAGR
jgi:hypothetical protein